MRRRLLWRVFPYFIFIIVASLLTIAYYGSSRMQAVYLDKVTSELEARARLLKYQLTDLITSGSYARLDAESKNLGAMTQTRITILAADGKVLADSDEDPAQMENHGLRPEIVQALRGEVGASVRYSNTLQREMRYVAIPLEVNGEIVAAVRTSIPVTTSGEALATWTRSVVVAGLLILLLAGGLSYVVFDRLSRPLRLLKAGADRFAAGDFHARVPAIELDEMGALADAMNNMASQLERRIATISEQRNEREAILASMTEGVLALDASAKVISMNRAAAGFFGADAGEALDRPLAEVVRSAELYEIAQEALGSTSPVEGEIEVTADRSRYLQVRGAALAGAAGRHGAVLVINDISRLKRLEHIRRDFVANVSHELRTPITAIIGAIETLMDGGVEKPDDVRRFLGMVENHAARLNTIVEDLLALSRLEAESDGGGLALDPGAIEGVIRTAISVCEQKGRAAKVRVEMQVDPGLEARIDAPKLEQAVINLLDNAIKASEAGSVVTVGARRQRDEIVIEVRDTGAGIDARHLPRLFERFYRVDSARSRERGGTGLGLAIVKHTALGHGGRVTVESKRGTGSAFRIHLPCLN